MRQLTQNVRRPNGKRTDGNGKSERGRRKRPKQSEDIFFCVCLFIKAKVADDAVPGVELVSVVGSSLLAVLGRCLLFVLRRVYVGQARESAGP